MNFATGIVVAFDCIAGPAALAAGLCLIKENHMSKPQPTPEALRLLEEARADYEAGAADRASMDRNIARDALQQWPAATFGDDGILRDGSDGGKA